MKRYLVMAMRKPTFDEGVIASHLQFLDELRVAGQLELTGGFSDKSGGAYVLVNVGSLEEARAVVARDPLTISGSSEMSIHEWNTR